MPAQERWNRDPVADAKRSSTFSAGDALLGARVVRVRRGNTTWLQHHFPLPITRRVDSADCVGRMVALPTEVSRFVDVAMSCCNRTAVRPRCRKLQLCIELHDGIFNMPWMDPLVFLLPHVHQVPSVAP
jgi:hypothetical protein